MAIPRNLANLAPKLSATGGSFATTIGVGGATPAASGAGITFPASISASSDANTLDDYEEGTWTPSYSAAFTGTYAANGQVGRYTKVGRLVAAYFWIQVSTVTGSGGIQLNGLPFAVANVTNYIPGAVIVLAGNWGTNTPFSVMAGGPGATTQNIKYRSSANGTIDTGNIAVSDLSANAFMQAVIVYEV
jgi:hypothetical protein